MKKNACRPAYICPPRLREGDRAALIATASPASEKQLAEAVRSLKELNLSPVVFSSCRAQKEYLSGDDRLRAHDLMLAFSDPRIRAIFCLRGGYGSARLLDLLDYNTIRQNPKIFAGFSDVTALHAAFAKHCGFITYHAPMPSYPYRKYDRHITLASLQAALFSESGSYELKKAESGAGKTDKKESCGNRTEGGSAPGIFGTETAVMNGRLLGGNLTVFASLLGTPYMPDTDGCILFLEDVGEKTYRIDRAFTSLRLAGKLKGCRGILLGTFSRLHPAAPQPALLSGDHKGDRVVCRRAGTVRPSLRSLRSQSDSADGRPLHRDSGTGCGACRTSDTAQPAPADPLQLLILRNRIFLFFQHIRCLYSRYLQNPLLFLLSFQYIIKSFCQPGYIL